jgi:hypothetical protein
MHNPNQIIYMHNVKNNIKAIVKSQNQSNSLCFSLLAQLFFLKCFWWLIAYLRMSFSFYCLCTPMLTITIKNQSNYLGFFLVGTTFFS